MNCFGNQSFTYSYPQSCATGPVRYCIYSKPLIVLRPLFKECGKTIPARQPGSPGKECPLFPLRHPNGHDLLRAVQQSPHVRLWFSCVPENHECACAWLLRVEMCVSFSCPCICLLKKARNYNGKGGFCQVQFMLWITLSGACRMNRLSTQ